MYTPSAFRITDRQTIAQFMAQHDFAVIVSHTPDGLLGTHLPFLLEEHGERDRLLGHMARANPHWKHFDGNDEAAVIFQGPHGYVSPSWYTTSPAVPTWNYAVVHAYGRPRVIDERARIREILERLVARHESSAREPWRVSDLSSDYFDRMTAAIVTFEIEIDRTECKFKLGQNRPADDVERVVSHLEQGDSGGRALAAFMRAALAAGGPRDAAPPRS